MPGCSACGAAKICRGCETIEGAFCEALRFPPEQAAALEAYWQADEPEAMRAAYYRLADVGLPLCNVEPSLGRDPDAYRAWLVKTREGDL